MKNVAFVESKNKIYKSNQVTVYNKKCRKCYKTKVVYYCEDCNNIYKIKAIKYDNCEEINYKIIIKGYCKSTGRKFKKKFYF